VVKVTPSHIEEVIRDRRSTAKELTLPLRAVLITQPEHTHAYTLSELAELSHYCKANKLPLIMDGARLPYVLANSSSAPSEWLQHVDAVTLSLTKIGGVLGAATIFRSAHDMVQMHRDLRGFGNLIDATYLIAAQFEHLFLNGLWRTISCEANFRASFLSQELRRLGITIDRAELNAVMVRVTPSESQSLVERAKMYIWDYGLALERASPTCTDQETVVLRLMVGPTVANSDIEQLVGLFHEVHRRISQ